MFKIDLLKGTEIPPAPRPMPIAAVTVAFCLLVVAAALDVVGYIDDSYALAAQEQSLNAYTQDLAQLAGVGRMLETNEKRRKEIDADLAEVSQALLCHTTWSPVLVALSGSASEAITVNDVLAKREEQKGKDRKVTYAYSIMMGVISPSGAAAVEQFLRDLREQMPLAPGPDSIRIVSQQQQAIEGRAFQYYVIECRLEP
jgi:hypothetical protein